MANYWILIYYDEETKEMFDHAVFDSVKAVNIYLKDNFTWSTPHSLSATTSACSYPYARDKKDLRNLRTGIVGIQKVEMNPS